MRTRLISVETAAAIFLLAAVVAVAPGTLSRTYAMMTIVAGVLPGLMLTGDVKLLNAGMLTADSNLLFKALISTLLNVPAGLAGVWLFGHQQALPLVLGLLLLATIGATAQAFSPVWFYTQFDKAWLLKSKLLSALAKVVGAAAAVAFLDLTWALAGVTLGAVIEFACNVKSLPWRVRPTPEVRRQFASPLGLAYGISRAVSAAIRLGLEQLFGALIASFLVIEQLIGGLNSLFDKYFARSSRWRQALRAGKLVYLVVMAALVPWLAGATFAPQERLTLLWLALVACAGLLPLSDMYTALQRRGQGFVALGSALVSLACAAILGAAWHQGVMRAVSLWAYVLLPGATFVFYWLSSLDDRHHTER